MNNNINIPFSGEYTISGPRDLELAQRVVSLIESEDLAFSKKLLIGHVTASAFLVNPARDRVLLTHHKKLGKWLQLGGHCDGIKDPYFIAKKEAYEESGLVNIDDVSRKILDIDIHDIPEHKDVPAHLHYDIRYLFAADENQTLNITEESNDLRWVPLTQLEEFSDEPSLLSMRQKLSAF